MASEQKDYRDMTEQELRDAMLEWGARVDSASGWPSAYFAAKQCRAIERSAKLRGFDVANQWPIKVG